MVKCQGQGNPVKSILLRFRIITQFCWKDLYQSWVDVVICVPKNPIQGQGYGGPINGIMRFRMLTDLGCEVILRVPKNPNNFLVNGQGHWPN